MEFKGFKEYLTEETKEAVFSFGRFNPPTTGHAKLFDKIKKVAKGSTYKIYPSQSQDANRNPIEFKAKVKLLRKMFPKHARNISSDTKIKTAFDIITSLYDKGFTKVTMVVGEDRITEFDIILNKYNGIDGRHGFYRFEGGVNVVSAGQRDPDAEDVSGMSASKMRKAALDNDIKTFSKGVPSTYKDIQGFFNLVRKSMGLKESNTFRQHVQLETVSKEREDYIEGTLFQDKDKVQIKESGELGQINGLGTNFISVILESGQEKRFWLDQVTRID